MAGPEEMTRAELLALVGAQAEQIAMLSAANKELAAKLARCEHLLSRNSGNSSMPPSKDDDPARTPPALSPKRRGAAGRKRGKQPGAPGAHLAWTNDPGDQRDRFPTGCCGCGRDLGDAADLGIVNRYQQHEIPQVSVRITQYDCEDEQVPPRTAV